MKTEPVKEDKKEKEKREKKPRTDRSERKKKKKKKKTIEQPTRRRKEKKKKVKWSKVAARYCLWVPCMCLITILLLNYELWKQSYGNRVIICQTTFLSWVPQFLSYELWNLRIELRKQLNQTPP